MLVTGRHDHEKVHAAVFVRLAVRIGAEQDDLLGESSGRDGRAPNCVRSHLEGGNEIDGTVSKPP